jgi:CheY-like chemotaxis protein
MVVEDEPDIYELLLAMFEMWGIEGVAFVDGEEAVSWIDEADKGASGELPELALLDIRLPGNVKGPDVGARIRKSPVLNGMAIVMITAYKLSDEERADVMKTAGADLLLNKPLPTFGELKQLLEAAIAGRHTSNAAAAANKPADSADSAPAAEAPPASPASPAAPASPGSSTLPGTTNSTNKTNTNTNAAEPVRKEK